MNDSATPQNVNTLYVVNYYCRKTTVACECSEELLKDELAKEPTYVRQPLCERSAS